MNIMHYVIVYGSLKHGGWLHANLSTSEYVGEVFLKGELYTNGLYPALIEGEEQDTIHAEAYRISDRTLAILDDVESNGSLYQRKEVPIVLSNSKEDTAWVYYFMYPGELQPPNWVRIRERNGVARF